MKAWSWKTWAMVAVLVVLFVSAAVTLVVAVATHEEPTFRDDAIAWEPHDFPLRTCSTDRRYDDLDPDARAALDDALETFDTRLGFDVFVHVEGEPCAVRVTFGVPAEPNWQHNGGVAEWRAGEKRCEVGIANAHGELQGLVVQHELGHCLGLTHDDYPASIMYWTQRETRTGAFPPRVSDTDRAALRERYAP